MLDLLARVGLSAVRIHCIARHCTRRRGHAEVERLADAIAVLEGVIDRPVAGGCCP
jgi:hypothetical protein